MGSARGGRSHDAATARAAGKGPTTPALVARMADAKVSEDVDPQVLLRRAANFMDHLQGTPPSVGYAGFMPHSRNVHARTLKNHWGHSNELRMFPEIDAMGSEAWTNPRSVRAAGSVLLRGKGPGIDFQDLHTRDECEQSRTIMNSAR